MKLTYLSCRFKPVDVLQLVKPIYEQFEVLFKSSFSVSKNSAFLGKIQVGDSHTALTSDETLRSSRNNKVIKV